VTYQCNAQCTTCLRWKNTKDPRELSVTECKGVIRQLKEWLGTCNISFTGGEPFSKEGFYELLEYADSLDLCTNVSSNGIVFDIENCKRIIKTGVSSVIFSLNSVAPALHDRYKGYQGLHQRIVAAIEYIRKMPSGPRVGVLCLITRDTYRSLGDFAQWAHKLGVDSIDFQPILDIHPPGLLFESPLKEDLFSLLLAQIDDIDELDRQIDTLIRLKERGYPIIITAGQLRLIKAFFRGLDRIAFKHNCTVGFRNLYIAHTGDVQLCPWFPPIGNIRTDSLKNLWFSQTAVRQRLEILNCKKPCLAGCMREYGLREKIMHFLSLTKR
jgi:MoaA/NifB/PqqE/SkfB family radical SAM enzyme